MWFALTYEKRDYVDGRTRPNNVNVMQAEGPWVDDAWRPGKNRLERMERREYVVISTTHIGCLLTCVQGSNPNSITYSSSSLCLALCLNSQCDPQLSAIRCNSFARRLGRATVYLSILIANKYLFPFIDRFKAKLPECYVLSYIKCKIFPNSPFSDDLSDSMPRSSSPIMADNNETGPSSKGHQEAR